MAVSRCSTAKVIIIMSTPESNRSGNIFPRMPETSRESGAGQRMTCQSPAQPIDPTCQPALPIIDDCRRRPPGLPLPATRSGPVDVQGVRPIVARYGPCTLSAAVRNLPEKV